MTGNRVDHPPVTRQHAPSGGACARAFPVRAADGVEVALHRLGLAARAAAAELAHLTARRAAYLAGGGTGAAPPLPAGATAPGAPAPPS